MDISIAGMFGNSAKRDYGYARSFAQAAESLGFRALYCPEHVVFFASYDSKYPYTGDGAPAWGADTGIYDPLFVFAAAAPVTTTLRFCTGVMILPQRPALLTAKEVLSLDHLTNGRMELGVGTGWSWEEYEALGASFARRGARMDEYLDAIKAVWTETPASYDGEFVQFENVVLNPKPIHPGGPPIIVGGSSPAAMKRAARRGDGWYGWWAQVEIEEHLHALDEILATHRPGGRPADPSQFSVRLGIPLAGESMDQVAVKVDRARQLGVNEVVLAAPIGTRNLDAEITAYAEAAGLTA